MTKLIFLQDLVIILTAAVVAVTLLRRLAVPSIAAFIVAGALIGPFALGLINELHHVEILAETGVVLLLFGIGLELSFDRVRRLWRLIAVGGGVQVSVTILLVMAIAIFFDAPPRAGLLLGFIVAVSSTAIVLRGLSARGELDTPHGRLTLGILIFQDLSVVPMVLVIPMLGGGDDDFMRPLVLAVIVLTAVIAAARFVVPRFLEVVARTRQRDLFVLSVFLICMGTAWAVSFAGVSLALGAFLAGLVVSGSRYREQAISDLVPLRDVLTSVFFVSVGMLLDLRDVFDHLGPIAGLFIALIVGKFLIIFFTATVMRLPLRVGILSSTTLSQVGEFSFVLLHAAQPTGLLEESVVGNLTLAIVLSMLVTPFLLDLGPRLVGGLDKINPLTRVLKIQTAQELHEVERDALRNHVIIAGYGLTGRNVARYLSAIEKAFVVVDLNSDNVHAATLAGQSACFGDITSTEVLQCLDVARAGDFVIAINDDNATLSAIKAIRALAPELRITARATYATGIERLREAGATYVIDNETAAANVITEHLSALLAPVRADE